MTYKNDRMPNEHECKCGVENEVAVLQNICENCLSIRLWASVERDQPDLSEGDIDNLVSKVFLMLRGKK